MRTSVVMVLLVASVLMVAGCQKQRPADAPVPFSEQSYAPPSQDVNVSPTILDDQAAVSRTIANARAAAAPPPPAATVPATPATPAIPTTPATPVAPTPPAIETPVAPAGPEKPAVAPDNAPAEGGEPAKPTIGGTVNRITNPTGEATPE